MGLVKVCFRQKFLHQNFYRTPETKYNIYLRRKLMYDHQNVVFHLFAVSAVTLVNIFKVQLSLELLSNIRFRWNQNISNIKTWKNVCFVDINKNLPYAICKIPYDLPCIISVKKNNTLFDMIVFFQFIYILKFYRKKKKHTCAPIQLSQFFLQSFNFCQLFVQMIYLFKYISQNRLSSRKQQSCLCELHLIGFYG